MDRSTRKRLILAKIESVYGTDPTPTAADNAVLIFDPKITPLVAEKKQRKPVRPYFGSAKTLLAAQHAEISFAVDFAGAGAAGTVPAYGPLLRACACSQAITAGVKVEYAPVTDSLESVTIYYHDDGLLHKLVGCRGTADIKLLDNDWPQIVFRFVGLKGGRAATANPASPVFTSWIDPIIVNDTNTGDITLGATPYPSKGLEISFGNNVVYKSRLGLESVRITDRNPTGRSSLDLTAAEELALLTQIEASTTQTLGLVHGTTAGNIVEVSAAAAQLLEPSDEDDDGAKLTGYALELKPGASGNDEFKITVR
ncbi:MAG: hypothetical protein Q7U97_06760 [Rhodocyclaceae bacterium]|nr:hypothetical protein [Rhodocyclaceae bacterium]